MCQQLPKLIVRVRFRHPLHNEAPGQRLTLVSSPLVRRRRPCVIDVPLAEAHDEAEAKLGLGLIFMGNKVGPQ